MLITLIKIEIVAVSRLTKQLVSLHIATVSTTRTQTRKDTIMNQERKFFWSVVMMIIITLGTFFVLNDVTDGSRILPFSAFFAGIIALGILIASTIKSVFAIPPPPPTIAAPAIMAVSAALVSFAAFAGLTARLAPLTLLIMFAIIAGFIAFLGFIVGLDYVKKTNISKRHVIFSLLAEFIVIATPMLWYIITHQEQIKAALAMRS